MSLTKQTLYKYHYTTILHTVTINIRAPKTHEFQRYMCIILQLLVGYVKRFSKNR